MIGLFLLFTISAFSNKGYFYRCSNSPATSNLLRSQLSYTLKEQWALEQFRPMVLDSLSEDYERKDAFLIRWLRACELDLQAATKMLQEAQLWRKQNNMSTILTESFPDIDNSHFSVEGTDREGNPIAVFGIHHYDVRKLIIGGRINSVVRFLHQFLERAEVKIRELVNSTGRNIQVVSILDSGGLTLKQHACFACVEFYLSFLKDFERLHPEFNRHLVVINSPRFAKPLADVLKSVVSKKTLKALKIFGLNKAEWSSFLLKLIAPDQLPVKYGGTKVLKE